MDTQGDPVGDARDVAVNGWSFIFASLAIGFVVVGLASLVVGFIVWRRGKP